MPFFFVSCLIEPVLATGQLGNGDPTQIANAVLWGNFVSYGLLALIPIHLLVQSRELLSASLKHPSRRVIEYLGATPDGSIAAGDSRGNIRLFDGQSGSSIDFIRKGFWATCMTLSPDGQFFGLGRAFGNEGGIEIRERQTRKKVKELDYDDAVYCVAFSPDSRLLASVGYGDMCLWEWESGGRLPLTHDDHSNDVNAVVFSPDGRYLAGAGTQEIYLWDVKTGQLVLKLDGHSFALAISFNPEGNRLAVADCDTVYYRSTVDGELVRLFESCTEYVSALAISPDGHFLTSGCYDGRINVWDIETGDCILATEISDDKIHSLLFSSDGEYLIAADSARVFKWKIENGFVLSPPLLLTDQGWTPHSGIHGPFPH